ncbi:alanine racemase [Thalassospira sp.]|uniref:alanine racemase n=1 Tax=Thalassospira sp. TaxID=1912094 RepID=UPI002736BAEA|nr:alanine racemase [Thalassospira sp.]MDP2700040.1 alanine racemase [Thalassospira sp.]
MSVLPASGRAADCAQLEINLKAIAENYQRIKRHYQGRTCAAVVKADAYGLGAQAIVPVLKKQGCRLFFVAQANEAADLFPLLRGGGRIAVLNGLMPGDEEFFIENDVIPVLNDLGQIERWSNLCRKYERPAPAFIHLDTGMNRLGLSPRDMEELVDRNSSLLYGFEKAGYMTHPASADIPDDPFTRTQFDLFMKSYRRLPPAPRGFCNSSAIFRNPEYHLEFCRPGYALWGGNPTPEKENPMRAVVTLKARILQLRQIDTGESVGYGASWHAGRPSRIATIAAGYADGWLRSLSNAGKLRISGVTTPMVGRVSMDAFGIDVTDIPEGKLSPGDMISLIGKDTTIDDIGVMAGSIGYEILTSLGQRYQRVYTEN